ncbi:hypothetical protein [Alistipes putredinis]|uniref:hypothetical protein n=1 Tax=Alistipes putredinis TaxID=28117 RepID=UPI003967B66C
MYLMILILGIILFVGCMVWCSNADKNAEELAERPTKITDPSTDLYINEKYAIVQLLFFVQGASAASAFDDEANRIVQSTIFSLRLPKRRAVKFIQVSMGHNPDREIDRMIMSLKEIRDRDYLRGIYKKCLRIADISGDYDMRMVVNEIFRELNISI